MDPDCRAVSVTYPTADSKDSQLTTYDSPGHVPEPSTPTTVPEGPLGGPTDDTVGAAPRPSVDHQRLEGVHSKPSSWVEKVSRPATCRNTAVRLASAVWTVMFPV